MIRTTVVLASLLVAPGLVSATTILTFDENVVPTNPENGFGSFAFSGFGGTAVTDGPTSLTIDAASFGGVGVDFLQRNFDPAQATGTLRLRVLDGNAAPSINVVLVESDVEQIGGNAGEQYGLIFSLGNLTPADGFVTLTAPLASAGSFGGAFGRDPGNGAFDPGLYQVQLQSPFGATDRLHVEVDYFQISSNDQVPEPAAWMLASLGGVFAYLRRR